MKTKQQARAYAAKGSRRCAMLARQCRLGFAGHVSAAERVQYVADKERWADEVEQGMHDNNFSVWQKMNYFITGQDVPFLPPPK